MRLPDYQYGAVQIAVFSGNLIDERTYVIRREQEAAVIDPHEDESLFLYLNGAQKVHVFLTHEHYDHISGVNQLKRQFSCMVYASDVCSRVVSRSPNATNHFPLLLIGNPEKYHWVKNHLHFPYVCSVDIPIHSRMERCLMGHSFVCWKSPGHSPGGMTILIDGMFLFSGDNLLGNGMELKSIGADASILRDSVESYGLLQGKGVLVFPGHGTADSLERYLAKVRDYYQWN